METIKLIIPGEPHQQERHRSMIMPRKNSAISVKTSKGVEKLYRKKDLFIHNYDPSHKVKKNICRMIDGLAPARPITGPVRVDRYYYFSYRKGHYGTGRNAGNVKPSAPVWKDTTPDIDNYDKLLFDCLGCFIKNDGQIVAGISVKKYSKTPRTEVFIAQLNQLSEEMPKLLT